MTRIIPALSTCLVAGVLACATTPVAAIAPPPDDERMILAHEAFVITFDAGTVVVAGTERRARMRIYLPAPDPEGYVDFVASEEIDCRRGLHRYHDASGRRADGTTVPMTPDTPDLQPIGKDTPVSVLRDHLCALKDLRQGTYGVMLEVPGDMAARAVFALLKVGLEAKPAAALARQGYADRDALTYNLDRQQVAPADRPRVIVALGPLVAEAAKPPPPIVPLAAAVASGRAGRYVHLEMELGAELWLKLDGTFTYGLTVGTLDEQATGHWTAEGDRIALVPDPTQRSNVEVGRWTVTSDGHRLTIARDGQRMIFERRQSQ